MANTAAPGKKDASYGSLAEKEIENQKKGDAYIKVAAKKHREALKLQKKIQEEFM